MTTSYSSTILVVLATNIKRGGHNEIHNVENSREALPSQVFPVVGKSNQRAKCCKGHISYLEQTHTKAH